MAQAETDNTRRLISIADLNIAIDSEPRIQDMTLGDRLGFARPRKVRDIIERNATELETYGEIVSQAIKTSARGGRPGTAYYLNEPQALLICMFSNTARAAEVRKMLIDVFMEYRRAQLGTHHVRAHERRTSTRVDDAIRLKKNIDRLEAVVAGVEPARQILTAMVVNGEPVIVDVNDFMMEGDDEAVILKWDGSLEISKPVNVVLGDNRFGNDAVSVENGRRSYSRHQSHGARSGMTPWRQQGKMTVRDGCVILGKVIRNNRTIEHEPHYRGRRVLYRDEILRLLGTKLTNRQIAQKTGATYQTVTHWRRWAADHRPELLEIGGRAA